MYTRIYTHTCVYICKHIHTLMYVYIYIYIHIGMYIQPIGPKARRSGTIQLIILKVVIGWGACE